MLLGNFHDVVFGAVASFFAKYGERAARRNLCSWNSCPYAVIVISVVFGVGLARSEVMWAASGCRGLLALA
jgi:hypothetical protein